MSDAERQILRNQEAILAILAGINAAVHGKETNYVVKELAFKMLKAAANGAIAESKALRERLEV